MPRGFPLQDTGPGMNELFHDLAVDQAEQRDIERGRITHGMRVDPNERHVIYYGKPSWPSHCERTFPRAEND